MSLNEMHHRPSPAVLRAIAVTAGEAQRTLDALGSGLSRAIAGHLDVPASDILVGPGSAALLQQLFSTLTGPETDSLIAWPSWEAYPMMAGAAGSRTVRVPLDRQVHDLDAMADAVTDRVRLVIVCNPNNPTGTTVDHASLERFLRRLPPHVTVVIDEAYRDFADDDRIADSLALYRSDERVCVVRTFSKSYGLLSLRVGYLIGHRRTLAPLRVLQAFFRVGAVAQSAAIAALGESGEVRERWAATARDREQLRTALREQGWEVTPSQANFLWLPMASDVERFTQFCADNGVLVCGKPGEGVRVTVAEPEANAAFATLAGRFRKGAPAPGAPDRDVPGSGAAPSP
ncbi:aminotransferase class I/II-fold pyridoxal phosphate-dependent enzyme [Streptomyces sp. NPDC048639]|uniref:aminotransferase class I/II-fold pyridoxal phosphate-dependent enzyme n=1 Tax=Streptomyces sp. NPDC048639 TaxID=3365581 RepID=UPI003710F7BB